MNTPPRKRHAPQKNSPPRNGRAHRARFARHGRAAARDRSRRAEPVKDPPDKGPAPARLC